MGTDPKEARYWLNQFQQSSDSSDPFAVVQVDNEVFDCPDMVKKKLFILILNCTSLGVAKAVIDGDVLST